MRRQDTISQQLRLFDAAVDTALWQCDVGAAPDSLCDGAEGIAVYTRDDLNTDHNAVSIVRVGEPIYDAHGVLRDMSAQGIHTSADGQRVNLDVLGVQAGLPAVPILLARQVWADIQDSPTRLTGQADLMGRVWDVIAGAGLRAQIMRRRKRTVHDDADPTVWTDMHYQIEMPVQRRQRTTSFLTAIYDRHGPCILIAQNAQAEAEAERKAEARRMLRQIQRDAERAVHEFLKHRS